ncbi:hypothetical protein CCACVL1_04141 [Corchorus capsularis]|uniref:CCHC-type domain-containing protein n=1 Tax=Corchorus capsularis TaxID=210143 RepID=A0A1R3JUZ4_COCAP|nr:hypothetical protein CCACVL1_04141 [Corchorus capsularis]
MASEQHQVIQIKLNGPNYSYWSYLMRTFLIGKELWGYVDGTIVEPDSTNTEYAKLKKEWETYNARILSWMNNAVEPSIGMHLAKFKTAKEVWDYLSNLYVQSNFAKRYELEKVIRSEGQKDRSIQDFYNFMNGVWDQLDMMDPPELSSIAAYLKLREEQKTCSILDGTALKTPTLPIVNTQAVLMASSQLRPTNMNSLVRGTQRIAIDECGYCHEKGHWKKDCPKKNKSRGILPHPSQGFQHGRGAARTMPLPRQNSALATTVSECEPKQITYGGNVNHDDLESIVARQVQQYMGSCIKTDLALPIFLLCSVADQGTNKIPPSPPSAMVKTQFSVKIKVFRSDSGGEYTSTQFQELLASEGYGIEQKGYRCYDPIAKRIRVSRHVAFFEHIPYYSIPESSSVLTKEELIVLDPFSNSELCVTLSNSENLQNSIDNSVGDSFNSDREGIQVSSEPSTLSQSDPLPLQESHSIPEDVNPVSTQPERRYPSRSHNPPPWLKGFETFFSSSYQQFLASVHSSHEQTSFKEASVLPHWQQAMREELAALEKNHTWDLVSLPEAKSYRMQMASRHWPLFQMDVKNAFLNGDLHEEVYMQPPPGYSCEAKKVCQLRRALYGLKQAPRAWFEKFNDTMKQIGFLQSANDSALFHLSSKQGTILLLIYVDDMIITGDDSKGIEQLKQHLFDKFEMKDLGFLRYFLGIEVAYSPRGYILSQSKYANDVINRARLTDERTADTPIELNVKLRPTDGTPLPNPTLYREIVGCLVYLIVTRPDIAYAVHIVSQFVSAPRSVHWSAMVRILRYLQGTLFQGLFFSSSSKLELCGFSDADWAGDANDRRSTTGFCIFLGDSLISWKSKKQNVVSRSSTEAEYRAMAQTSAEIVWLQRLLQDMGVHISKPVAMFCDNKSATQIAHNSVFHERTKHIEEDCVSTILSLTSPEDAFRSSLVSSTFRSAIDSDIVWGKFLPPDWPEIVSSSVTPLKFSSKKQLFQCLCDPVLIDGGNKIFKLEKSSGKKTYVLSANELSITWSSNPLYWTWISMAESRFSRVAVLRTTDWLEIQGKIRTKLLSSNTRYGAYLIMRISDRAYGLDSMPSDITVEVGNQVSSSSNVLLQHLEIRKKQMELWKSIEGKQGILSEREDGWMEMELGEFFSGEKDEEVKMSLMEVKGCHLKGGLVIEGIEVRPKH